MRRLWLGVVAAAALLPSVASAQSGKNAGVKITWTRFIDPSENAFAADVPQGWTVKGGVTRLTTIVATGWLTAVSPDGAVQIFVGDPEIPFFNVPRQDQQEGAQLKPTAAQTAPEVALRYRGGIAFAELYGPSHLAAVGCTGATPTARQDLPDIARRSYARSQTMVSGIRTQFAYTPPQHEAGLVTYTCQSGGRPFVAGVIADTAQPIAAGFWSARVMGYLAAPNQAALAKAILLHVLASRQWNPQWDQATREAAQQVFDHQQQEASQMEAILARRSWDFTNMLLANGEAMQAQRTASHNAFMAQMEQQSAQRSANFAAYQAQRSLNSWRFNAYVRNGQLYRNVNTGEYYEVDH